MDEFSKPPRPEPPAENLARVGSQRFPEHVNRGYAIVEILEGALARHGMPLTEGMAVYDFGCGVGRVLIPFSERFAGRLCGSDVDPTAIAFLNEHFAEAFEAVTTPYEPPLPFADDSFDVMYSISVWSHFPRDLQLAWLSEMQRIMKPGALLLITTTGLNALRHWHARGRRLDISVEQLTEQGMMFLKNQRLEKRPDMFPGVTGDWGVFYQTPDYVRRVWSELFSIEEIAEATVGNQDLVILRNDR